MIKRSKTVRRGRGRGRGRTQRRGRGYRQRGGDFKEIFRHAYEIESPENRAVVERLTCGKVLSPDLEEFENVTKNYYENEISPQELAARQEALCGKNVGGGRGRKYSRRART